LQVAILTSPGDHHAHATAWGLGKRGHDCDLIYFGELPQRATISVDPAAYSDVTFESEYLRTNLNRYERYWLRRPADAILPKDIHESDKAIARLYWNCLLDGLTRALGDSSRFCINPPVGGEVSRLKVYQLPVARSVGLRIPRSIVTTSGADARGFVAQNRRRGKGTILKPLYSALWDFHDGGFAVLETTRVAAEDISDASLQLAPCIFQEEIKKKSEVRLTVMGRSLFAAELESQAIPGAELDFRRARDWDALGCKPISVPKEVAAAVLEFQRRCRLNFGTMDFIIDEDGQWVFLETNPSGQFLWVEKAHPETPLLDAFLKFIIAGSDEFEYAGASGDRIALADFHAETEEGRLAFLHAERRRHVQMGNMTPPDRPLL